MSQPTITVEAAFGNSMLDPSPSWTDISGRFRAGSINRGRGSVDSRFDTGTASITLDNRDGHLTPDNTSSPYYPDVIIGTPVRITAEWESVVYPLFYGSAMNWPPHIPTGNIEATVTVPLADGFYDLNLEDLAGETYPAQRTDQRVAAVLNDIGWPAGLRNLDTGVASVQPTSFAIPNDGGEQPALNHLLDVAESEAGILLMGPDGKVVFENRVAKSGASPAAVYAGQVDYSEIDQNYADSVFFNVFRVAREDGVQVQLDMSTGRPKRTLTRDVMPMGNDAQVRNVAEWLAGVFGVQRLRISGLRFKPLKDPDLMADMLSIDLRGVVRIQLAPPGGDTLDQTCAVESINHDIAPGDWTTSWSVVELTELETQDYWILGTSQLGVSTRLA